MIFKRFVSFLLMSNLLQVIPFSLDCDASELRKIRIYLDWFPSVEFAGIYAAIEKGWYRDAGIEILTVHKGLNIIPAVEAGEADIGLAQGHDLIRAIANGSKINAFAANYQMSPVCILVGKDSNIKSVKDLKGKVLGIFSPQEYDIYKIMLASNGLTLADVKFKNINTLNELEVMSLMKNKFVDGVTAWEFNWGVTFSLLNYNVRVIPADQNGFHYYGVVFFGTTDYLKKNGDLLKSFLKVTYDGWREVYKHPDRYAEFTVKNYYPKDRYVKGSLPLTLKQQKIELRLRERYFREGVGTNNMGRMSRFKWQQSLDISKKFGIISNTSSIRVEDIVDMRFLETSKVGAN